MLTKYMVSLVKSPTGPSTADLAVTAASRILDNACSTGIVTCAVKPVYPGARIVAYDLSDAMQQEMGRKVERNR
jgi:trans-aconitate methyltransferase